MSSSALHVPGAREPLTLMQVTATHAFVRHPAADEPEDHHQTIADERSHPDLDPAPPLGITR